MSDLVKAELETTCADCDNELTKAEYDSAVYNAKIAPVPFWFSWAYCRVCEKCNDRRIDREHS